MARERRKIIIKLVFDRLNQFKSFSQLKLVKEIIRIKSKRRKQFGTQYNNYKTRIKLQMGKFQKPRFHPNCNFHQNNHEVRDERRGERGKLRVGKSEESREERRDKMKTREGKEKAEKFN